MKSNFTILFIYFVFSYSSGQKTKFVDEKINIEKENSIDEFFESLYTKPTDEAKPSNIKDIFNIDDNLLLTKSKNQFKNIEHSYLKSIESDILRESQELIDRLGISEDDLKQIDKELGLNEIKDKYNSNENNLSVSIVQPTNMEVTNKSVTTNISTPTNVFIFDTHKTSVASKLDWKKNNEDSVEEENTTESAIKEFTDSLEKHSFENDDDNMNIKNRLLVNILKSKNFISSTVNNGIDNLRRLSDGVFRYFRKGGKYLVNAPFLN